MKSLFILSALIGCATTKSHVRVEEQYRSGCVSPSAYMVDSGSSGMVGSTAIVGVNSNFGLAAASSYDGSSVLPQIQQELQMALEVHGFRFVRTPDQAEVLLAFSIGTVRYDPIIGWVADQASLVISDRETGDRLEMYQVKSVGITATTTKLIRKLSREAGYCVP
jgi:hypothetical protein